MVFRLRPFAFLCLLLLAGTGRAQPGVPVDALPAVAAPAYPQTPRQDLADTRFGVPVADPYRWLESDAADDPRVAAWVREEDRTARAYLDALPGRGALKARLSALFDYEHYGLPRKAGDCTFYTRNSGLQNQAPLYLREREDGPERLLLDPNRWSTDGTVALAQWEPSVDGRLLLVAQQRDGTDWRTLRILDVRTGELLPDEISHVRYSGLAWRQDGTGFFYSAYGAEAFADRSRGELRDHRLYFHRIGTPQSQDRLVFASPSHPRLRHFARVSDDGRWLIVLSSQGSGDRQEVRLQSLVGEHRSLRQLTRDFAHRWTFAGSAGDRLYFRTDDGAPRGRIVVVDATRPGRRPIELVPEQRQELVGASLVGDRLVLAYLSDGRTAARLVDLDGNDAGPVRMPGFGTAAGFGGTYGDPETFFRFSDFTSPNVIYRFNVMTGETSLFARPRLPFDPDAYVTELRSFRSKDGTQVPLYLVRRKDVAVDGRSAPTMLYGYGGFNSSLYPRFSPARLAWLEQGGVLAVAGLRGGGEFGQAWHDAGRLGNKQNVFDDFIAAAEYLRDQGITGAGQLAIEGRSNGGLLVGAVVNQRPDLFAAAIPSVGVFDMLRFDRFTAGRFWIGDYGDPDREADFHTLLAYSPYHNIRDGAVYPAILVMAAEADDRVVPAHSYKYAAALQHADIGARPHLLRVEQAAGHGGGTPVDLLIGQALDMYSFAAHWTGLEVTGK